MGGSSTVSLVGLSGIQGGVFVSCGLPGRRGDSSAGLHSSAGVSPSAGASSSVGALSSAGVSGSASGSRLLLRGIPRVLPALRGGHLLLLQQVPLRSPLPVRRGHPSAAAVATASSAGAVSAGGARLRAAGLPGGSIRCGLGRDVVVFLSSSGHSSQNPLGVAPSWKNRRQPGPGLYPMKNLFRLAVLQTTAAPPWRRLRVYRFAADAQLKDQVVVGARRAYGSRLRSSGHAGR